MRYLGSKKRFVKELIPIITEHLNEDTVFIDMFGGGMNVISEVDHKRKIAVDINRYVISLWQSIKNSHLKNEECNDIVSKLSRNEYYKIKQSYLNNDGKYSDALIGYVANCCSYGSSWFNGYASFNPNKKEDHIKEAYNGILKQIKSFKNLDMTNFICMSYKDVTLPPKSVIYCDPPYANTKKYEECFNNEEFWQWVREKTLEGHYVYISEYSAPIDFKCVWEKVKKDTLPQIKNGNKPNKKIEKLFVYEL